MEEDIVKRILILTNSINGLYSFRRELVEELIKEGYKVIISSPIDTKITYFRELGCCLIETQINRRGTNPIVDIKLLLDYLRIIKKYNPSVVLTYTIKPNVYGGIACRLLQVPYIANITGLGTAVENGGYLQKLTILFYKISLKKANCVFFQNDENRQFFVNMNIVTGNYTLIPGSGVNLDYFKLIEYPNDDIVHFLFIARVMKEKGIEQYLDEAKYIRSKYPNTVFHIQSTCE